MSGEGQEKKMDAMECYRLNRGFIDRIFSHYEHILTEHSDSLWKGAKDHFGRDGRGFMTITFSNVDRAFQAIDFAIVWMPLKNFYKDGVYRGTKDQLEMATRYHPGLSFVGLITINVTDEDDLVRVYIIGKECCHQIAERDRKTDLNQQSECMAVHTLHNQMGPGCQTCKKENAKLSYCHDCKIARYCSRQCQKDDWPYHKPNCLLIKMSRKFSK